MKTLLVLTLLMGSTLTQAGSIECTFDGNELFGITIDHDDFFPIQSSMEFKGKVILTEHGPRLFQSSKQVMHVSYLNTRVDVARLYDIKMGPRTYISLRHNWYHPQGKTYFKGHYNNRPLTCESNNFNTL